MASNRSFSRSDLRFATKHIRQLWKSSTPEERDEIVASFRRFSGNLPALIEGYSPEKKRPAKDGTVTFSAEKLIRSGSSVISATMSKEESTQAVAKLIGNLLDAGAEFFPGQITIDRKVALRIIIDWAALVSTLALAKRRASNLSDTDS